MEVRLYQILSLEFVEYINRSIHVFPSVLCPGAEDRLKGPRGREIGDCVDVGFVYHIVK